MQGSSFKLVMQSQSQQQLSHLEYLGALAFDKA
jgi:hypothetical protein